MRTPEEISEQTAWVLLRAVIDPELGCNVVDLGLIYEVTIAGAVAHVKMTLSTRGCPMHDMIVSGVERLLVTIEGVDRVEVELVWEPAWTPARMSPQARAQLGVF